MWYSFHEKIQQTKSKNPATQAKMQKQAIFAISYYSNISNVHVSYFKTFFSLFTGQI